MADVAVWTYVRAVMSIMFHLDSSNTATDRPIPPAVPDLELERSFSIAPSPPSTFIFAFALVS
jgi:hypothetical protein